MGPAGQGPDPVWANRMPLLKAEENLSERGWHRLAGVFSADDPAGSLEASWQVKEHFRTLLNTGPRGSRRSKGGACRPHGTRRDPETSRLYMGRWWAEIEVLIVANATTAKIGQIAVQ